MGTFNSPTKDTSVIVNPSLNAAGRTFDRDTDSFDNNPGTWDNPFANIANPSRDTSVVVNPTIN